MIVKTIGKWILFCSAASLLTTPFLLGQGGRASGSSSGSSSPVDYSKISGDPNAPHSFSDQAFVRSTLERGNAELQLEQFAREKGQSDDVKTLSQRMVDETAKVEDGFKAVAGTINAGVPKEPSKKDKQALAKIQALTGPQFDEETIKLLLKYKRQDAKDFQVEAGSADDRNVQQAARQDAPVVAQHVKEIEQVALAHKIPIDGKN